MKISHPHWFFIAFVVLLNLGFNPRCAAIQTAESAPQDPPASTEVEADQSPSNQPQEPSKFLKLQLDEFENPVALQTATKKYVLKDEEGEIECEVILESVIHIADPSYYRSFQKRFERYDSVLYELVKNPEENTPAEGELPMGYQLFQQLSTATLGLAYQLEEIDYSEENMLHADLSPSEIAERMADRGETKTTLLIDLVAHILKQVHVEQQNEVVSNQADAEPGEPPSGNPFNLSLLKDPDGIMKIRRVLAATLVESQLLDSVFPQSIHRLLIGDRNDRVMSVLNSEKKKGKRRIAIFYGAGHMADFEHRLVNEYGMQLADVIWRNAWDLRDGAIEGGPLEAMVESAFRDSLKDKLEQWAEGQRSDSGTGNSDDADGSTKDEKIKSMEKTLKALEAKLKKLESQANDNDKNSQDSDESKPKTPDADDGSLSD